MCFVLFIMVVCFEFVFVLVAKVVKVFEISVFIVRKKGAQFGPRLRTDKQTFHNNGQKRYSFPIHISHKLAKQREIIVPPRRYRFTSAEVTFYHREENTIPPRRGYLLGRRGL